jgi:hypothetical protein
VRDITAVEAFSQTITECRGSNKGRGTPAGRRKSDPPKSRVSQKIKGVGEHSPQARSLRLAYFRQSLSPPHANHLRPLVCASSTTMCA